MRQATSFCRLCAGKCAVVLTIDDDERIAAVSGDRTNPMTSGYVCGKGLQAHDIHHGPDRLLRPLKRMPDGSFEEIGTEQALDEIAERIGGIVAADGPDALATFRGTMHYANAVAFEMLTAFIRATRTRSRFSTMTIDQSAKWVTELRMGRWTAGRDPFEQSDVWLFAGYNPLVSVQSVNGMVTLNPVKRLRDAKARGMKIIVVDPRATETARYADVFLQPLPGEDPTLFAGLLRIILTENLHDTEFCAEYVDGLDELRHAVEPFTPRYVERRAGVPAADLHRAAQVFATARRGTATAGTGPDMAPRSNLAEHLVECLNVVCGRFQRAGDEVPNPGAMSPRRTVRAQVAPPRRSWETGHRSRVRGLGTMYGEMMSATLAEEITAPGPGRIRALLVDGGNPANALPDRRGAIEALGSLDLLVTIDPYLSATARLAHYVLPPTLMYERPDLPVLFEKTAFPQPYAQYAPAVLAPPPGSDVLDDWYVFWGLARRLGLGLTYAGVELDMEQPPDSDELLALLVRDAEVPLEEIRRHPSGAVFRLPPQTVQAGDPGRSGRFAVMPPDVAAELAAVAGESADAGAYGTDGRRYSHRLAVRRMREVLNTTYHGLPVVRRRRPHNPAWLHSRDLAALGVADGDDVVLESDHGRIRAVARADDTVRPGVVSMSHGWGAAPGGDEGHRSAGSSTSELVRNDLAVEPINGMPRFSAIPVDVLPG
ncbi:molybdopterin-dependent oxidoreductase [Streptomyces sp. SID4956]|uniref:molybdopterin-dependent oxidoreductase n=1 Tax=Streptomyces sp. SID4956 TaxID=2690290 RepID=UPI00136E6657|nr:molybdopterin-dependent oxidoreductase [Streptomyces sp. SID4956]